MNTAPLRVTVGVLTFRRPQELEQHLPTILEQVAELNAREDGRWVVDVLVVDNDPDRSAREVLDRTEFRSVRQAHEPVPGIAAARNRVLDECADSDLLAFIDDDEQPQPDWLLHLLTAAREHGAGVVRGRVVSAFDGELDPWLVAGRFFRRPDPPTGTEIHLAAAGNLLLDLNLVRASGVRFDLRYGITGGEDTMFTRSLDQHGIKMIWCYESVAIDRVPRDRMTRSWALARALSHGNTTAFMKVDLAGPGVPALRARLSALVSGVARSAFGLGRWAWGGLTRSIQHRALGTRMTYRGFGMAAGSLGFEFLEYARPDGKGAGRRQKRLRRRRTV